MEEKQMYTAEEVAQMIHSAIRVKSLPLTTKEEIARYEEFVPENVRTKTDKLTKLIREYYHRASWVGEEKLNPNEDAEQVKGYEEFLDVYGMMKRD